jgi:hypothetical protein
MLRLLLAALCAAAIPALATPQPRDATDMWFDPAESGWGLNLIHQGDTLFATLFVYGADRQPKWFVASELSGGPTTYSGTLRECTGAWFGGPFSAAPLSCRDVGPMRFDLSDTRGTVDYTVDGVRVVKQVQRFSFRRTTLEGGYEGYMVQPAAGGTAEVSKSDLTLHITRDDSAFTMDSSSDSQSPCTWNGTPVQDGQYESVSGTYLCNGNQAGSWAMKVDPTTEGFTGSFTGAGITGWIAAARTTGSIRMQGPGYRNDMWFVPAESGWGLNVIEQGDTIFATLFVYDSQGRARWYVASNLMKQGESSDGQVAYSGALAEATGPYFGAAFDPSGVVPRGVGNLSFLAHPDGSGDLSYSVDGVQVNKVVRRFAFRKQDFSGSYRGSYAHDRQADITIDDAADFRMTLVDRFGGMGTCTFLAPYEQLGSLRMMNGSYSCAGGHTGTFSMRYATVSAAGFTSRFDTPMFDFRAIVDGHIAGARR